MEAAQPPWAPAALLDLPPPMGKGPSSGQSASSRLLVGDQIHPCIHALPWLSKSPSLSLSSQGSSPRPSCWPFIEIHFKGIIAVLKIQTRWLSRQDLASPEKEIITFLNFLALFLLRAQDVINLHFCCTFPQSCPQTAHPRGAPEVSLSPGHNFAFVAI